MSWHQDITQHEAKLVVYTYLLVLQSSSLTTPCALAKHNTKVLLLEQMSHVMYVLFLKQECYAKHSTQHEAKLVVIELFLRSLDILV